MRLAVSHESLMVPFDGQVRAADPTDPLSQSFPDSALHSALSRQRNSYSPASNSGNLLQVPDNNTFFSFASDRDRRGGGRGQNAIRASSSLCDLSASAQADILRQNLAEGRLMSGCPSDRLLSISPPAPPLWLCLSPRTSPQTSPTYSPFSSSCSISTLSPPFSPDSPVSNMAYKSSSPINTHLLFPNHASYSALNSPALTPSCSPYGSPFGSQTQICIKSVGAEC